MNKLHFILLVLFFSFSINAQETTRGANVEVSDNIFKTKNVKAIIIGVSEYKNINQLEYADDDAQMFYEFLISRTEVDPNNISVFLNSEATKETILTTLNEKLGNATKDDLFLIYFAGHGDKHSTFNRTYLLLSDAPDNGEYNLNDAIEIRDIQDYASLAVNNGATVFLAIDACHSGKFFDERETELRASIVNDINNQWQNFLSITACGPNQLSMEDKKWGGGHGVFTFYLVNGLKGASDDGDNTLTFRELSNFVSDKVYEGTNEKQEPVYSQQNGRTKLLNVEKEQKDEALASITNISDNATAYVSSSSRSRGVSKKIPISVRSKFLIGNFENLVENNRLLKPLKINTEAKSKKEQVKQYFEIGDVSSVKPYSSNIFGVDYSPDGKSIVIAGDKNGVKVLDSKTLKTKNTFNHKGVLCVDYSPYGDLIATGSWMNNVKIWNTETNKLVKTLTEPVNDVRTVCFSPSGMYIAAGGNDKRIHIWRTDTWELHKTLPLKHKGIVNSINFAGDDDILVSNDGSGKITIWNITSGKIIKTLKGNPKVKDVKVVSGNIIYSNRAEHIVVWSLVENKLIDDYNIGLSSVNSIVSDYSSKYIFVAGDNYQVKAIDRTKKHVRNAFKSPRGVTCLSVNSGFNNIIGVTYKGHLFTSKIKIPQQTLETYAYDSYLELISIDELEGEKNKLKATLGAALLLYVRETITPFVKGDPVLPDNTQILEAKRYADTFIELYKEDEILTEKAMTLKMLLEVYEIIVNNELSKLPQAIKKLDQIKEKEPDAGFTYNTQTLIYQKQNKLEKAKESASVAIERVPKWTEPKSNLGKTHFMNHDYDAAIAEFNKIVVQRPDLSVGYSNLGNVYSFLKAYSKAANYYKTAIALDTLNPMIYCSYADLMMKQKEFGKAEQLIFQSISINEDYALPYYEMGEFFYRKMLFFHRQQYFDSADYYYSKAVLLNSKEAKYQLGKAKLYYNAYNNRSSRKFITNKYHKTKIRSIVNKSCNNTMSLDPYFYEVYYWKAINISLQVSKGFSFGDKTKKDAFKSIKRLISKQPNIPESYYYTAKLYMAYGDTKNALKYLKISIKKDDKYAPSYNALLYVYKQIGDKIASKELKLTIKEKFEEPENFSSADEWVEEIHKSFKSKKRKR